MSISSPYDFVLKRGDTEPAIERTLERDDATVDLTGAAGVRFEMETPEGTSVISSVANITAPAAGEVSYPWQAGDTDTVGTYLAEFVVEWSAGNEESFPNSGDITVRVNEDRQA